MNILHIAASRLVKAYNLLIIEGSKDMALMADIDTALRSKPASLMEAYEYLSPRILEELGL